MDVQKLAPGRTQYFFKPGMKARLRWFPGVLSGGNPDRKCSFCPEQISGDRYLVRILDVDREAWLHARCFVQVVEIRKESSHAVVVDGDDQDHVHPGGAGDTGLSGRVGVVGLAPVEAIRSGAAKAAAS